MKKIFVTGIIVVLLTSMFVGLVPSSVALPDWTVEDDIVFINDTNVYLSATPHTITSSGWVYFNLTAKNFTGNIDALWGFNTTIAKPTKPQVPDGWENKTSSHTFHNVSSFSATGEGCDYGHSYNIHKHKINYSVNKTAVICYDSRTPSGAPQVGENYTTTWHTRIWRKWNDISPSRFVSVDYEYGGMDKWYYIKEVAVVAGKSKQLRAWVEVPISLEEVSGKYWFAVKPSSETISEAIANGHFYALDPWYNSSWSHRKQWTVTNVNATTLTNYAAYINVSDEPEMQADWDDVVFTDSTGVKIPYELENYTTGFGDYWVNVTIPASSTVTGWVYYGNAGASSQENPEGVYDNYTKMVHHMQDLNDSTSNNNDFTNHGATYTSSGQVDGAYDYNGSSDYGDCGNDPSFNITDAITIEAWVKWSTVPSGTCAVVAKDNALVGEGYGIYAKIDGKIKTNMRAGVNWEDVIDPNTSNDDFWHHFVATYDGEKVYLYRDGLEVNSDDASGSIDTNNYALKIGAFEGGSIYFNGTIDEVRIYNRALSNDEINQSYEMVANQSSWVTWGSAEEGWVNAPINLAETHNNFWVNWTWGANNTGDALHTDSFNTSYWINANHYWDNSTNISRNETVGAHGWLNISLQAYNSSTGKLSSVVSGNQQISNNPITITNTSDWQGDEGTLLYLDFNYTDLDNDTAIFATDATKGTFNTITGVFEWQTDMDSQGIYFWNFTVSDGWGSEDFYVATITVGAPLYEVISFEIAEINIAMMIMALAIIPIITILTILIAAIYRREETDWRIVLTLFVAIGIASVLLLVFFVIVVIIQTV